MGVDAVYVVFPVLPEDLEGAVAAARTFNFLGVSITIPHKESVVGFCDELTAEAQMLGAVNTLQLLDGRVIGHNTDGQGFLRSLLEEKNFDVRDQKCAVIGAGGAAKAVIASIAAAGAADISIVNRSPERAKLAARVGGSVARVGVLEDVSNADLVVNATPIGMTGESEHLSPVPADVFSGGQVVADLIYKPSRTVLMSDAEARGASVMNGLGMLIHQAARQIEIWTGQEPPVAAMRVAVEGQ